MKFTVVWAHDAEGDLAKLWVSADSLARSAIRRAADMCDRALARDAQIAGSPRSGNRRTLHIPPLIIDIEVILDDRLARVLSVRLEPVVGSSSNGRPA
jgi:hypothetical protein